MFPLIFSLIILGHYTLLVMLVLSLMMVMMMVEMMIVLVVEQGQIWGRGTEVFTKICFSKISSEQFSIYMMLHSLLKITLDAPL